MKPYYKDSLSTIYHSNCALVLPELPTVDLVLTDPPYDFVSKGGGFFGNWKGADGHTPRTYNKELENLNCTVFDPSNFLSLLKERHGYYFCNKELIDKYILCARELNYSFDVHVLSKPNPIPAKNNHFLHDVEYCVYMRPKGAYFNSGFPLSFYKKVYEVATGNKKLHPAQKPIDRLQQYIQISTEKGHTVLDPFMGSGTTLVAAKNLNRYSIGIELEEKYCEIAANRLCQQVIEFD